MVDAVPGEGVAPAAVEDVDATLKDESVRELAAQFEDEKPGRRLGGVVEVGVTAVAAASALLVLWQVFRPLAQGGQYYLAVFLSGVLPLVFVVYPSGIRLRRSPKRRIRKRSTRRRRRGRRTREARRRADRR